MSERPKGQARTETDAQGSVEIAAGHYYGINTARAKNEWFSLGIRTSPFLINAYLYIKQAYAQVHDKLQSFDSKSAQAIVEACTEMRNSNNDTQFIAESLQAVSGITINTNINEVIANRAEEILGGKAGEYKIVQPELVNLGQDIESIFSLATKLAVLKALSELEPEILNLERLLRRDALTLAKVLKVSASPSAQSTTGQWGKRLNVFTTELEIAIKRIKEAENNLLHKDSEEHDKKVSTADDAKSKINSLMLTNLAAVTGFKLKEDDLQALNDGQNEFAISDLVLVSSALKDLAAVLSKVANVTKMARTIPVSDSSAETPAPSAIQLFADSLHMAAYQVVSNNFSLTFLAQCEQLESGMLMPLLSHNLLSTIELLHAIVMGFQRKGLL